MSKLKHRQDTGLQGVKKVNATAFGVLIQVGCFLTWIRFLLRLGFWGRFWSSHWFLGFLAVLPLPQAWISPNITILQNTLKLDIFDSKATKACENSCFQIISEPDTINLMANSFFFCWNLIFFVDSTRIRLGLLLKSRRHISQPLNSSIVFTYIQLSTFKINLI